MIRPPVRGVRYSPETQSFELRCTDCVDERYWPLTLEFWEPGQLQRCRACEKARRARAIAKRRRENPEWYASTLRDVRELKALKNSIYNRAYRERRKARDLAAAAA